MPDHDLTIRPQLRLDADGFLVRRWNSDAVLAHALSHFDGKITSYVETTPMFGESLWFRFDGTTTNACGDEEPVWCTAPSWTRLLGSLFSLLEEASYEGMNDDD